MRLPGIGGYRTKVLCLGFCRTRTLISQKQNRVRWSPPPCRPYRGLGTTPNGPAGDGKPYAGPSQPNAPDHRRTPSNGKPTRTPAFDAPPWSHAQAAHAQSVDRPCRQRRARSRPINEAPLLARVHGRPTHTRSAARNRRHCKPTRAPRDNKPPPITPSPRAGSPTARPATLPSCPGHHQSTHAQSADRPCRRSRARAPRATASRTAAPGRAHLPPQGHRKPLIPRLTPRATASPTHLPAARPPPGYSRNFTAFAARVPRWSKTRPPIGPASIR